MFGYVTADLSRLSDEQLQRYRGCYCGLCRSIGSQYGTLRRIVLNYDLTFLALLLSSLYEPEETACQGPCGLHPMKKRPSWRTAAADYAAAMNVALAYEKCRDDWADDRRLSALLLSSALEAAVGQIREAYPRQWQAMSQCMDALSRLEAENCQEPDLCANAFGALMEELFVWKADRWEPQLRQLGRSLGRFIYLMDAILDLPRDLEKRRYNPFQSRAAQADLRACFLPVLTMLMGECTDAFEQLPLVQDLDLLRNILYSGVWVKYRGADPKESNYVG